MHANISQPYTVFYSFLVVFALAGCNAGFDNIGNGENEIEDGTTFFGGVDSHWVLELDDEDDDFQLSRFEEAEDQDGDAEAVIRGTRRLASSGYTILDVNTFEGDTRISENDTITILDVNTYVIYMQNPESRGSEIVPLVTQSATCPNNDATLSWMTIATDDAPTEDNATFFGSLAYSDTQNNQSLQLQTGFSIIDMIEELPTDVSYGAENCDDALDNSANNATLYLADNNAFIVQDTTSDRTIIAQETLALSNVNELDDANGYIGFVFDASASSNARSNTISADCSSTDGEGSCTLFFVTDPDNGDRGAEFATIDWDEQSLNSPSNGFIPGTITLSSNQLSTNLVCITNTSVLASGNILLNCFAPSPQANADDPDNPDLSEFLFFTLYAD